MKDKQKSSSTTTPQEKYFEFSSIFFIKDNAKRSLLNVTQLHTGSSTRLLYASILCVRVTCKPIRLKMAGTHNSSCE